MVHTKELLELISKIEKEKLFWKIGNRNLLSSAPIASTEYGNIISPIFMRDDSHKYFAKVNNETCYGKNVFEALQDAYNKHKHIELKNSKKRNHKFLV